MNECSKRSEKEAFNVVVFSFYWLLDSRGGRSSPLSQNETIPQKELYQWNSYYNDYI